MSGKRNFIRPLLVGAGVIAAGGAGLYAAHILRSDTSAERSVAASATPPAGPADPENGRQVYDRWCAACHAPGAGHPGTQSLAIKYDGALPAALEERTDLTPEITAHFVRNGVGLMPFFRKTEISDAELRDLAAYLAREE